MIQHHKSWESKHAGEAGTDLYWGKGGNKGGLPGGSDETELWKMSRSYLDEEAVETVFCEDSEVREDVEPWENKHSVGLKPNLLDCWEARNEPWNTARAEGIKVRVSLIEDVLPEITKRLGDPCFKEAQSLLLFFLWPEVCAFSAGISPSSYLTASIWESLCSIQCVKSTHCTQWTYTIKLGKKNKNKWRDCSIENEPEECRQARRMPGRGYGVVMG